MLTSWGRTLQKARGPQTVARFTFLFGTNGFGKNTDSITQHRSGGCGVAALLVWLRRVSCSMASLLYCVTLPTEIAGIASGVWGSAVQSRESAGLRTYWSEIASPEAFLGEPDALKKARLQFHQVLREILAATTPIPFRFPTLLESEAILAQTIASEQELYRAALERIGEALQYEIIASWEGDERADLATPVSGSEYRKRRQQVMARVNAVDTKLKNVTAGSVREWRARQERKTHHWFALVPRDCREHFVTSLRNAGASEGVRLRLNGPQPPGEFVFPVAQGG